MHIYHDSSSIAIFSDLVDSHVHSHYFMQVAISLDESFNVTFNGKTHETESVLIDMDVKHQLQGKNTWQLYLLIDPNSRLGKKIRENLLKGSDFAFLDSKKLNRVKTLLKDFDYRMEDTKAFNKLMGEVQKVLFTDYRDEQYDQDPRIMKVREILSSCELNKITVTELSKMVFLSESRLSHLFKKVMGISFSSYLLYLKLKKAMELVQLGRSCTDAAYEAGFSDSAHLSRTFKQKFGMSPKNLKT